MNKLLVNTYQATAGAHGYGNAANKKGGLNASESLFGMAFYDFTDSLVNEQGLSSAAMLASPAAVPRAVASAAAPPAFHPVDEYKDLSLKEILDLSDDFLSNDDDPLLGSTDGLNFEPVPFGAGSAGALQLPSNVTSNLISTLDLALSSQPDLTGSLTALPTLTASSTEASFNNLKKRSRDSYEDDIGETSIVSEDSSSSNKNKSKKKKERRFRPYQAGQWSEKFNELNEYKDKMGHCLVPHTYHENLALARWVKRQRYQYKLMIDGKSSTMTPDRVQALEDIGFVWDSQGAAWGERLGELADFKQKYMHCNVPSNFAENPRLATWIKCQRRQYKLYMEGKQSNMTQQRIQHLENLGFEWELRSYKKQRTSV